MSQELADAARQRLFIGIRAVAGPHVATGGAAHARMVAEADVLPRGFQSWLSTEREGAGSAGLVGADGSWESYDGPATGTNASCHLGVGPQALREQPLQQGEPMDLAKLRRLLDREELQRALKPHRGRDSRI